MKLLRCIKYIKKHGVKNFIKVVSIELNKKSFILWQRLMSRDKKSYSQYAEDLFLDRLLGYKENGYYVDVGANNPEKFNNTKKFYDRGWRGINIEPNYKLYKLFVQDRVDDININAGISNNSGVMPFYSIDPDTISTFVKSEAMKIESQGYKLKEVIDVPIKKLSEVFKENNVQNIDFISIDTEGHDAEVLKSNDWDKYRPSVICIEGVGYDDFLENVNYKKVCTNGLNSFYINKD